MTSPFPFSKHPALLCPIKTTLCPSFSKQGSRRPPPPPPSAGLLFFKPQQLDPAFSFFKHKITPPHAPFLFQNKATRPCPLLFLCQTRPTPPFLLAEQNPFDLCFPPSRLSSFSREWQLVLALCVPRPFICPNKTPFALSCLFQRRAGVLLEMSHRTRGKREWA